MDLLPASSLLSPSSGALIRADTQFHLTEPAFLPALIYGPDHDWRGNLKESKVEAEEASGKGRERRWERPGGPLIHCLLARLGRAALVMGIARWVLSSELEQSDSVACVQQ